MPSSCWPSLALGDHFHTHKRTHSHTLKVVHQDVPALYDCAICCGVSWRRLWNQGSGVETLKTPAPSMWVFISQTPVLLILVIIVIIVIVVIIILILILILVLTGIIHAWALLLFQQPTCQKLLKINICSAAWSAFYLRRVIATFVSRGNLKCRLWQWLLYHPMNHIRSYRPRPGAARAGLPHAADGDRRRAAGVATRICGAL